MDFARDHLPTEPPGYVECARRGCDRPDDGTSLYCIQHANEHRQRTGEEPPGAEGAICYWCGQGMRVAAGCVEEPRELFDGAYDPVRVGRERGWDLTAPCYDCGSRPGRVHHPGCDIEECPRCGRQLISCGCYRDDG